VSISVHLHGSNLSIFADLPITEYDLYSVALCVQREHIWSVKYRKKGNSVLVRTIRIFRSVPDT